MHGNLLFSSVASRDRFPRDRNRVDLFYSNIYIEKEAKRILKTFPPSSFQTDRQTDVRTLPSLSD